MCFGALLIITAFYTSKDKFLWSIIIIGITAILSGICGHGFYEILACYSSNVIQGFMLGQGLSIIFFE